MNLYISSNLSFWTMISAAIRELRFILPTTSSTLKKFIVEVYPQIKSQNPHLNVLVRESQGVKPTIVARLDKGVEVVKHVDGFSNAELKAFLSNP